MSDDPKIKTPATDANTKLTEEQTALAEEVAVRTAEEITGRHKLTDEQRAVLQGHEHDHVIDDKIKFSWPIVLLIAVTCISVGGSIWQTAANAEDNKATKTKLDAKADASDVVDLEKRLRVVENAQAANAEAHKNIEQKIDKMDGKLDKLLEKK